MDYESRARSSEQVESGAQELPSRGTYNTGCILLVYRISELDVAGIFLGLSIQDRLLSPLIIMVMIVGVVIGEFCPNVQQAFDTVRFDSVSVRQC